MQPIRKAVLVFFFFGLFFTLSNSYRTGFQLPDEEYVLQVTSHLAAGESPALPENLPKIAGAFDIGKDGKSYASYQIGQSLLYLPFFFVAKQLIAFSEPYSASRFGTESNYQSWLENETRRYLFLSPAFFSALSCALFFLFAIGLGYGERAAFITTLFYGFGTMVWPYSKSLLTEATQNALLLGTVYLLFLQRREGKVIPKWMILAGASFGLLLSIRAIFIALAPILAVYWYYKNQEKRLLLPLLLFGVPAGVWMIPQLIYDSVRFGNIFALGYRAAGFTTPLWIGLYGYILSPGKSFFLYAPLTLLGILGARSFFRRSPVEALLFLSIVLLVPLKYGSWWIWTGDPAWGPRYLLVLTPFLLLPATEMVEASLRSTSLRWRAAIGSLATISFFISFLGVAIHYLSYFSYVERNVSFVHSSPRAIGGSADSHFETSFVPQFSPILGHAWMVKSILTGDEKPFSSGPWKSLGLTPPAHEGKLQVEWDIWLFQLIRYGLEWINIKLILGTIALIILWTIFAQELFRSIFVREN